VAIRASQLDDRASEEFVRLEAETLYVLQSSTASFADQALEADESGVGVLMSDLSGTAKLLDWRTKIPKVSMRDSSEPLVFGNLCFAMSGRLRKALRALGILFFSLEG